MELLKLSRFKLQLRALISELQQLKERERSATEQLNLLNQKQRQTEEEFGRKLQELQVELSSSLDSQCKLETKVNYLENDNFLLENKQKELKGTIESLLQSRETFMSFYQDSTCEIKRSIEVRDRKLAFLSEKIKAHFLLFDSIEKEAISVKQVVDNVQQIVSEKEVAGLTRKMDQISAFEKDFINKIQFLENKLRYTQEELRTKDAHISELRGQLEAAKISSDCHPEKSLSMKDEVIENITAEKKALRCEVRGLEIALQKIQDAVMSMEAEVCEVIISIFNSLV
ncbi:hypothetical protein AQUCO_02500155v1 [Aquilegia coerulea]|uniref:Uncharacterized protein n=1 Tax=Aquilegia coerulea TaxID=218851 RepID=A0A2G5D9Q7_AQUCA|nr:hypothetical protein AQUCO_02500155v1 [Aquilegia coerulea]